MNVSHEFLMPDYYPDFSCKMGACRSACCEGWPISFSMTDYFKLLGVECSPELRRKLDCSMRLCERPSPESYAQISPRYDGQCPMRLEDGRCGIHAELGEEALAAVCRLYPRCVHTDPVCECSCANSCEAVLEMLLQRSAPMTFRRRALTVDIPQMPRGQHGVEITGREQEIRLWLISLMQNRAYPLPQRILLLGAALNAVNQALTTQDMARVEALLSGQEALPVPEAMEHSPEPGLDMARHLLKLLSKGSGSIRPYAESVLAYFGEGEAALRKYLAAEQHFQKLMPQWEIWFEHMLVNHMFFTQFPFQEPPVPLKDEFLSLCAVYVLLRLLCIGWVAEQGDIDEIVTVAAKAFRLIDHTDFDRYAAYLLNKMECCDALHLRQLLCI